MQGLHVSRILMTVFIDNTGLVKDEYYEADGIHMSSNYYPEWLDHMAEVADL